MPAPNTSLQRTRSSASPPRSPLSSQPLGVRSGRLALIAIMVMLALVSTGVEAPVKSGGRYRVFFPKLQLAVGKGERITWLQVRVYCGRFRAVAQIPDDWSLEVGVPISGRTSLSASAGSDSAALRRLSELDGVVAVSVEDASCFDIAASVQSQIPQEGNRNYEFGRSELILKP